MRLIPSLMAVMLCLFLAAPGTAAASNKHGVGIGVVGGNVHSDDFSDEIQFEGVAVYGKFGFTENWGLLVSYRDMEDDENFIRDQYEQFGVHAVYMWRPDKLVRPHVKFGVVWTDFEAAPFPGGPLTEDDANISVGGGLEVGGDRFAFYGDFDYSEMDFILIDLEIANVTLGVMFKF